MWVFALILAWPMLEIGLFVVVGGWIGLWATLAWVILSAVLGIGLIRWQGMGALREVRGGGGLAALQPMAHSGLIMLSGMLLILPGFFTDFLGLVLLIPPVRMLLIAALASRMQVHGFARRRGPTGGGEADWVDAEYEEVVPERDKIGGVTRPSKWRED
ncbi:exclusion protein FxsA [Cypionkella aquatica]|uniref:Exclusion protein FxsA n=1 Tax=Cypionkella aquatica TaxID=1756042 RepID=A0AA37U2Q0_9RHOB|nr:FxsA family protein [Cypionkella aquatica]GLS86244.1 exclusion protein FxsA [Cypionkella aquatica]